jgi:hypothetical protein
MEAPAAFPYASLDEALASGDVDQLLGTHWQMLANLFDTRHTHPKLRAPGVAYVAQGEPFVVYDKAGVPLLHGAGSYAAGGMSNAWGAQLFRYTDADIEEAGDWPINATTLDPFYADLEAHIGIAGEIDDMAGFLGGTHELLPAVEIVPAARHLLARYQSRREALRGFRGLRLGRSRLAVLTRPHRNYPAYAYGATEFFRTDQPGLYTARRTLDELRATDAITYLGGMRLSSFRESSEHVEVEMQGVHGMATLRARHLLLGCGTLHTAKLVLAHAGNGNACLPFIDHPPTLLPLFLPAMFGASIASRSFPVQLVATLEPGGRRDMISLYTPMALLWSDMLGDIPLPMDAALRILPGLLGGMLVAQIWEASRPNAANKLRLDASGSIRVDYAYRPAYSGLGPLLRAMRGLGAYSSARLASMSPPGWGFHYAACLPMRRSPAEFETHVDGRLWNSRRVRVIDGSVLPSLPAKNHSFTLMANAARIADETQRCGY